MEPQPTTDPQKRLAEFHGKTCVVETSSHKTYVGRCSRFQDEQLIMVDLDQLEGSFADAAVTQYLDNALEQGHWPKIKKVFIPKSDITRMDLLVKTPWKQPGAGATG
ncbi:MAG: hypothetical protein KF754_14130 [Planctomycetes bacterium]|nr:hypothetical protein [Planctomycetota bacterium]